MVLTADVFIVGSIIFLGLAYFYSIWDCARKDFKEKCKQNESGNRVISEFMFEVAKQHPENKSFSEFYEEYINACKKTEEIKI